MTTKPIPPPSRLADNTRKLAIWLLKWAFWGWEPHTKDYYKHMPLGVAILMILLALFIMAGMALTVYSLLVN